MIKRTELSEPRIRAGKARQDRAVMAQKMWPGGHGWVWNEEAVGMSAVLKKEPLNLIRNQTWQEREREKRGTASLNVTKYHWQRQECCTTGEGSSRNVSDGFSSEHVEFKVAASYFKELFHKQWKIPVLSSVEGLRFYSNCKLTR